MEIFYLNNHFYFTNKNKVMPKNDHQHLAPVNVAQARAFMGKLFFFFVQPLHRFRAYSRLL